MHVIYDVRCVSMNMGMYICMRYPSGVRWGVVQYPQESVSRFSISSVEIR